MGTGRFRSAASRSQWHIFVRTAWIAGALLAILLLLIGIPLRFSELSTITPQANVMVGQLRPQDLTALKQAGISLPFYAAYFTASEMMVALIFILVAAVLFARRSDDWMALLAATVLLAVPLATPLFSALERAGLIAPILLRAVQSGFALCLVSFALVFPDGRFIPGWTRRFCAVWAIYAALAVIAPAFMPPVAFGGGLSSDQFLPLAWVIFSFSLGVAAQVYRYRRVSTLTQRQQTKWVVWGFVVWLTCVCIGLWVLITSSATSTGVLNVFARMMGPVLVIVGSLIIPLTIGLSILRYRLWDIDLIIRRTLIYGVLTALLALVYATSVILLQQLFRGLTGQGSDLAVIFSTLAIAALFNPFRTYLQNAIEQRFYRYKYDAAQVLGAFSATVQEEVDLQRLTEKLVEVVEETMRPEQVSVWLRKTDERKH